MKCKVCGTQNEDYLEYCESCAAVLDREQPETAGPATGQAVSPDTTAEEIYQSREGWNFVKAPVWPKPEFDANTITEDDIPKDFHAPSPHAATVSRTIPQPDRGFVPAPSQNEEETPQPKERRPLSSVQRTMRPRSEETHPDEEVESALGETKAEPIRYAPPVSSRLYRQSSQDYEYDEEDEKPPAKRSRSVPGALSAATGPANIAPRSHSAIYSRKSKSRSKRSKKTILTLCGIGAFLVLVFLVLLFVISGNFGGDWGRFFAYTFAGDPIRRPATIEPSQMEDGSPAYLITIYARSGYMAKFTSGPLVQEHEVTKGQLKLRVPEQVWIPAEPIDAPSIEVEPDIVLTSKDGTKTATVPFEENITITLPAIPLTITAPPSKEVPSDSPFIDFVGVVGDTTASVFINDVQTDVDESGNFTARYDQLSSGANTIRIEARKNGYQIARETFTVTYNTGDPNNPAQGNVNFSFDTGEGKFRTLTDSIEVTGTMEAGVTIAVSGATLVGDVSVDNAAGTFKFTVSTPSIGVYAVNVTGVKDGTAQTKPLYLERAHPDKDAYMNNAQTTLDYQRLKDYPNHEQSYQVRGTVAEILQAEPYVIARLKTSGGDIIFCYYNNVTTVEANDGKTYRIFAEPAGTHAGSSLPMMHAWYILKSSSGSTPVPDGA